MDTTFETNRFTNHDFSRHDGTAIVVQRSRIMFGVVAILTILTILGLMLAFYQVVLGAVAQGESLQEARNQQSAAYWRCSRLRSGVERDNCLFPTLAEVSVSTP